MFPSDISQSSQSCVNICAVHPERVHGEFNSTAILQDKYAAFVDVVVPSM